MRHRKLRIAFSVTCGIACMLLIMFWVRSYSWDDAIILTCTKTSYLDVVSVLGDVTFHRQKFTSIPLKSDIGLRMTSTQVTPQIKEMSEALLNLHSIAFLGFTAIYDSNSIYICVPYWLISILFALLCGLPWYWRRFNFSLRTLSIAFTVLAVLLGFIGWLVR
jgi:hypothetical protein